MKTVSVTDLKNSLSARMKLVMAGESLLVTDHRKPVAVLSPLAEGMEDERMAALVAAGLVSPPRRRLDVKALLKRPRGRTARSLSEAVMDDREGR
jgi:prevent-host-death family protein